MSDDEVRVLTGKVDRILFILNNDHDTDQPGLVSRFNELEHTVSAFVNKYNTVQAVKRGKDITWRLILGFMGGLLSPPIFWLVKYLVSLFHK